MIGMSKRARICAAASTPSMSPFKRISISTRSGRKSLACCTATVPELTTPTTRYPRSLSLSLMPLATRAWSSTTRILAFAIASIPVPERLSRKKVHCACEQKTASQLEGDLESGACPRLGVILQVAFKLVSQ